MPVTGQFSKPALRHKIGRAHALYVMNLYDFQVDPEDFNRRSWVGIDSRGRELEITGIDLGDCFLVVHVMPTRRVKNYGKEGE